MTAYVPPLKFDSLKGALHSLFGEDTKIIKKERVAGGDINEAWKLTLSGKDRVFMKCNKKENLSFFMAEAAGLSAIAKTGAIGTPRVLCCGTDEEIGGCSFLLLELIEGGRRRTDYWEVFAKELADMHKAPASDLVSGGMYGFIEDNYIGAGKQINTVRKRFLDFFRECRLEPQIVRAGEYFNTGDLKKINLLLERLDDLLVEPKRASLVHGDLWAGNVMTGNNGKVWLLDPAVYVGHAEADIAMTELFGGFPRSFYAAYKEEGLLQPGYDERRDLYNLYHLLNHLNMFGLSYFSSVKRIIEKYTS